MLTIFKDVSLDVVRLFDSHISENRHPCVGLSTLDGIVMRAFDKVFVKPGNSVRSCIPHVLSDGRFEKFGGPGCIYCNGRFDGKVKSALDCEVVVPKGFRRSRARWSDGSYPLSKDLLKRKSRHRVGKRTMKSLVSYGFRVERKSHGEVES